MWAIFRKHYIRRPHADHGGVAEFEWRPYEKRFSTRREAVLDYVRGQDPDLLRTPDEFAITHWRWMSRSFDVKVMKVPPTEEESDAARNTRQRKSSKEKTG